MTSLLVLQLGLIVLASTLMMLGGAIMIRRLSNLHETRVRERRQAEIRPLLMQMLTDDELDAAGMEELRRGQQDALEDLIWQMLTKVRGSARVNLVEWLRLNGAIGRTQRRTRSRSAVRRATAAERLGAAGLPETAVDVARLLEDRHREVRVVAVRSLGKLGEPAMVPVLFEALEEERDIPAGVVSMALLHIGPAAIDGLKHGLSSGSASVRAIATGLLGIHGANVAVEVSQLLLVDSSNDVRVQAANALGRIGVPSALEPLSTVATTTSEPVLLRLEAIRALGVLGATSSVKVLRKLLDDENAQLIDAAARSLVALGATGNEALHDAWAASEATNAHVGFWLARSEATHAGETLRRNKRSISAGAR